VRAQRIQLERQFQFARECYDKGMSYDEALAAFADDGIPLDFQRLIVLSSYWEFSGQRPETADPASETHLTLLQSVATEAKLLFGRRG